MTQRPKGTQRVRLDMKYYSLNKKSPPVDFKTATINGQAPDKGLYFPGTIPRLPSEFWQNIHQYTDQEIAFRIMQPYVEGNMDQATLKNILEQTINFPFPLVRVTKNIFCLELFHGPTLAFKDVGAKFMSLCLSEFARDIKKRIVVLVATSGDTGGAVAKSFHGVQNVDVVILYPSGKVSPVQEKQLTTLGDNIHTIEVLGDFDDCQALVKKAFADEALREEVFLTSANSINVSRWLPQQIYYALGWKQFLQTLPNQDQEQKPCLTISVPSGNFGNIAAGILLQRSGLPVTKFIAACNANDVVPNYLLSGNWEERQAQATLSNAMDVAHPSNFTRIMQLFLNDITSAGSLMVSGSTNDNETRQTIRKVYQENNYVLDPHSAVAFHELERYQEEDACKGIILGTAHPVKFPGVVEQETGKAISIPGQLKEMMMKPSKKEVMPPDFEKMVRFIKSI